MIPTIEDILDGVLDETYTRDQALRWLEKRDGLPDMRNQFAAMAMQGLLTCPIQPQSGPGMFARDAVVMADALIEELSI